MSKFIEVKGYTPGAVIKRPLHISVDKIKMVCPNKGNQEETLIYFGHNDFLVIGESVEQVMEKINGTN